MGSTDQHLSVKMMELLLLRNSRKSEYGMRLIQSWALRDLKVVELLERSKLGGWSICTR
jgi:hypothetical protein